MRRIDLHADGTDILQKGALTALKALLRERQVDLLHLVIPPATWRGPRECGVGEPVVRSAANPWGMAWALKITRLRERVTLASRPLLAGLMLLTEAAAAGAKISFQHPAPGPQGTSGHRVLWDLREVKDLEEAARC